MDMRNAMSRVFSMTMRMRVAMILSEATRTIRAMVQEDDGLLQLEGREERLVELAQVVI